MTDQKKTIRLNGTAYNVPTDMTEEEIAILHEAFTPHQAPPEAGAALDELVATCWQHPGTSGSEAIADLLRSLYNGAHRCDLSVVHSLDLKNRQRLALVLQWIGFGPLWDYTIREAFRRAGGDAAVDWFESIGQERAG